MPPARSAQLRWVCPLAPPASPGFTLLLKQSNPEPANNQSTQWDGWEAGGRLRLPPLAKSKEGAKCAGLQARGGHALRWSARVGPCHGPSMPKTHPARAVCANEPQQKDASPFPSHRCPPASAPWPRLAAGRGERLAAGGRFSQLRQGQGGGGVGGRETNNKNKIPVSTLEFV